MILLVIRTAFPGKQGKKLSATLLKSVLCGASVCHLCMMSNKVCSAKLTNGSTAMVRDGINSQMSISNTANSVKCEVTQCFLTSQITVK